MREEGAEDEAVGGGGLKTRMGKGAGERGKEGIRRRMRRTWKCGAGGGPGQEGPMGPGPAPAWSPGAGGRRGLPAAALEREEEGGGEGCQGSGVF